MSGLGAALLIPAMAQHYAPSVMTPAPLLLDSLSAAAAFSAHRKLRTAYAGSAFRVRRTDNTEQDIGFVNSYVDTAALLTFCGATSGYVTTWYDQSGNGRNLTQATTGQQPRIVNAGVLDLMATGPAIRFDGTDDRLFRADGMGFSGSVELTAAWSSKSTAALPPTSALWHMGGTSFGTNTMLNASNSSMVAGLGKGGSAYRNFTLLVTPNNPTRYIGYRPASNRADAFTLEANGVALAQAVLADGTDTAALVNTQTNVGQNFGGWDVWPGSINFLAYFAGAVTGANLTALRDELTLHAPPNPAELIASGDRKAWYRADQGITLNATRISTWANIWSNGNLVQAVGGSQPLFEATGLGGQPCSYSDDGFRCLIATLTSAVPIGSRAYMWIYAQIATLATSKYLAALSDAAATSRLFAGTGSGAGTWNMVRDEGTPVDGIAVAGADTVKHLFEIGFTSAAAVMGAVSGVNVAGTLTGTNAVAMDRVSAHSSATGGVIGITRVAEIVVSLTEPSAAVKTAMRAYFAARYGAI